MTERRKIKRKVMAWLLAVVMVFTVTPSTVFAAEGNETEEHTHGTPWDTTDALPTKSGTYYLTSDISLSSTYEIKSGTVNLCLNGHVIEGNCSNSMIKISSDATLNIYDCQTTEHKFTSSTVGAWNLNESTGDRAIEGGVITGGNSAYGSVIDNAGTFNMYGGNIVGNTSTETDKVAVKGGVIYNEGTITIYNDVNIMGNYGAGHGATIFNNGTFYNYGNVIENIAIYSTVRNCSGTFYNGTADNHGDAIINQNLTLHNGTEGTVAGGVANYSDSYKNPAKFFNYGQINENESKRGSGGVINKAGEFTNYGTINNNIAARHSGGVDNTSTDRASNQYSGTFFKNYGEINGNIANGTQNGGNGSGGGVYNEGKATFYNYGSICKNKAKTSGGGFLISNNTCSLVVGRDSVITGNEVGSFDSDNQISDATISNICLNATTSSKITFDTTGENKLTDNAIMGVHISATRNTAGCVTDGYTSKYGDTDARTYFFADNSSSQTVILNNNEIYLTPHVHNWNYDANGNVMEAYCTTENPKCSYEQTTTNTLKLTLNANNAEYTGDPYEGAKFDETELSDFCSLTGQEISEANIVYYTDESLTTKTDTDASKGAAEGAGSAPKNIGTYYATLTIKGANGDYTAKDQFTISPKSVQSEDVTVEIGNDGGLEYNGNLQSPVITVKDGNTILEQGTDYKLSGDTSATVVDNYSITITGLGKYKDTRTEEWKITQKAVTVNVKDGSKTYGEADPAFTYEVDSSTPLVEGDTLNGITVTRTEGEDVSTYTMTATQSSGTNPNYNITFTEGTFTINKGTYPKSITKTIYLDIADENVTDQTFAVAGFFGEDVPTDAKIEKVEAGDSSANVVINVQADTTNNVVKYDTTSSGKSTDATDTYTVTISSKNYTDFVVTLQFAVATKEEVTLSGMKVDNKTYDKTAVSPSGTIVAKKTSDSQVVTIPTEDYVYTWEENTGSEASPNWQTLSQAPANAGSYRLTVSVALTNAMYKGSSEPYEFAIAKKEVTVVPLNQSIYVNQQIDKNAVTYKGFIGTDNDVDISTKATVACNVTDYTIADTYKDALTISNVGTLTDAMAKNYELVGEGKATLNIVSTTSTADEQHRITLGSGVITTDTIKEDNLPKTEISNLSVTLAKALLEDTEVQSVEQGAKALIYLDLIDAKDDVTTEDKAKIAEVASSGFKVADTYLDLSLYKKVGDASAKKLTDLNGNKIAVEIKLPTEMCPTSSANRTYKVIRMHDGVAVALPATYDKTKITLTFETDKFSVYAIAYKDTQNSSGGGGSSSGGGSYYYPVTGITVTPDKATLTKVGETVQLTKTISPSYATNQNVTWSSDNEAVAKVDSTGKVTAVGNGIATITVTTQSGNKSATSVITVNITPEETVKPSVPTGTDTPIVPSGTDKPVVPGTLEPTTPVETEKPIVSATPVIIVTSDAPKPSIEPTAPNGTEASKETAVPEVTITPTVTVTPKPTVKPSEKTKKVTSDFGALKAKSENQTSNTITLSWTKLSDADGYLVYGSRCNSKDKKYTRKLIKTIKGNSTLTWTQKKLEKATYYKYQIKAYKIVNGKKVIIAQSVDVHAATKGGKHCVASAVKVTKLAGKKVSKSLKLSLKKGKTAQITASEIPAEKNKTIHHHRDLRHESSNRKVAIVTESGKIKAVGKGTCKIWVYAQNGVYKTITVTVK